MVFEVTILGSNSAIPAVKRHPTSQLVNVSDHFYLLDCGEGTQIQMRKYGVKFQRISCIFISHLHGDHYFGLIGLLNTMHLLGREKEIHIYGPKGLKEIIELQLDNANGNLRFPMHFHLVDNKQAEVVHEDKFVKVSAVPVKHKIPTFSYIIEEQAREPNIKKSFISEYRPGVEAILQVKRGGDYQTESGETIPYQNIIEENKPTKKYAFVTDTKPSNSYMEAIREVDLLYHEATFTEEHHKRAGDTYHSTAKQAAEVALSCNVKELIIGHFSSRYTELEPLLLEAREVFEKTRLATEGEVFKVG